MNPDKQNQQGAADIKANSYDKEKDAVNQKQPPADNNNKQYNSEAILEQDETD